MADMESGNPDELCKTLTNFLNRANDPIGTLPPGVTPVEWAVRSFIASWRDPIRDSLDNIDQHLEKAMKALDAGNVNDAKSEIECLRQAIAEDIRGELGLTQWHRDESPTLATGKNYFSRYVIDQFPIFNEL